MSGKRPRVKFIVGEPVVGSPKYADLYKGQAGKSDSVKIVLEDEEGEFETFLTMRVAELLSGHGIIEQLQKRDGESYLKVQDRTPLTFEKRATDKGSIIIVTQNGVELERRVAVNKDASTEGAAPGGRGGAAQAKPLDNTSRLRRIHYNYAKAFEMAEAARKLYDEGNDVVEFQALVTTFFIQLSDSGVDCTPASVSQEEEKTQKQSSRRAPSRRGAPAQEPSKESFEDLPPELEDELDDDLPF